MQFSGKQGLTPRIVSNFALQVLRDLSPQLSMPTAVRGASGDSSSLTVETIGNHVYFYADVDTDRALALIRELRRVDDMLRNEHTSRGLDGIVAPTPIWLHIQSNGGDLFAGFSIADQMALIKSPIYTVVEGVCASAGTLISMSGSHRYILPNGFMLVHQLSSFVWGTHENFKDDMALQEMAMSKLATFYATRTKVSEEDVKDMMKRDFWMDADTCLAKGFVTEIMRK